MQNIISGIIIILTSGLLINIIKKEVYQYLNGKKTFVEGALFQELP